MKTDPEVLSRSDQTEIIETLAGDGMRNIVRAVSGLMETQLAEASMNMLAVDAFPQRAEEAEKNLRSARRYRNFLEVCEELRGIAQDNEAQFCSVKITPSEVKEITAVMDDVQRF